MDLIRSIKIHKSTERVAKRDKAYRMYIQLSIYCQTQYVSVSYKNTRMITKAYYSSRCRRLVCWDSIGQFNHKYAILLLPWDHLGSIRWTESAAESMQTRVLLFVLICTGVSHIIYCIYCTYCRYIVLYIASYILYMCVTFDVIVM